MRRLIGQAAWGFGRGLHALATFALGVALIAMLVAGGVAWRLSQGPINVDWLARRLDAAMSAGPSSRLSIGSAALAWEGWRRGVDRPLDIRLTEVLVSNASGATLARIPRAELSLSFGWLVLGRIVPRAIEIDGAHLRVLRAEDGSLALDLGAGSAAADSGVGAEDAAPLNRLLAELSRPRQNDRGGTGYPRPRWSQLRRLRIRDADVVVIDRTLGQSWHAPKADLDLRRHGNGGLDAHADLALTLGEQTVELSADASIPKAGGGVTADIRFMPVDPVELARAVAALAPLGMLNAPIRGTLHLDLELDPRLAWRRAVLEADIGPGVARIGQGTVPILGARADLQGGPGHAELRRLELVLAGRDGAGPVVEAHGDAHREGSHWVAALEADIDSVPIADLGRYWPAGVARWPREWVTQNVTAGTARAAHLKLALQAADDGSQLTLTAANGQVSGDDLTIYWLRPEPPIEHVKAELALLSADALVIKTEGGREAGTTQGGIVARNASIKVTGLSQKDQFGDIDIDVVGSVPDALALLRHPRLHLFDRFPIDLRNPAGQVTAKLLVSLPLDARDTFDAIGIHSSGQIGNLRLGAVLAGRDLEDALLDFDVDKDGLRLKGSGQLGGVPAQLGVQMDFRAGPASQVLRRYSVSANPSIAQLAAFGLTAGGALTGSAGLEATLLERRSGAGEATLQTDLRQTGLEFAPLAWRKPPGQAGSAGARILLDHDRITGVDRVTLDTAGATIRGSVDYANGKPAVVRLDRIALDETRAQGKLRLAGAGQPVQASLSGSSLDLSRRFAHHAQAAPTPSSPPADASDLPWAADLRFDRVLLGGGRTLTEVSAKAESDGQVVRQAQISGRAGRADRFSVAIEPVGSGRQRRLTVRADDAGALLGAFDILSTIQGGSLALSGTYDDRAPGHPLSGTAELTEFRLREAPAATRVLQAMTLYGLVAALRGPGIGFSRLVAPFRLADDVLELDDARAFSPSLGFTARGWIDLARRAADVRGTIVPAYFFNSLLGDIPLLGRMLSPEKGGGVFAATYSVKGPLDDPAVAVNPLAALTPGFLRGLFGIFEPPPAARPSARQ